MPVVDETGLKGTYDVTLKVAIGDAENDSGPSIFRAVREQLGLKLQASKRPVNFLVIDDAQPLSGQNEQTICSYHSRGNIFPEATGSDVSPTNAAAPMNARMTQAGAKKVYNIF